MARTSLIKGLLEALNTTYLVAGLIISSWIIGLRTYVLVSNLIDVLFFELLAYFTFLRLHVSLFICDIAGKAMKAIPSSTYKECTREKEYDPNRVNGAGE
jgi:hypothetical protein